jgi:hypothetical protein
VSNARFRVLPLHNSGNFTLSGCFFIPFRTVFDNVWNIMLNGKMSHWHCMYKTTSKEVVFGNECKEKKVAVFWVVALCSLVEVWLRFRHACRLWNVDKLLPDYTAQQPRRQLFSYSPPWEPEISHYKEEFIWHSESKYMHRKYWHTIYIIVVTYLNYSVHNRLCLPLVWPSSLLRKLFST